MSETILHDLLRMFSNWVPYSIGVLVYGLLLIPSWIRDSNPNTRNKIKRKLISRGFGYALLWMDSTALCFIAFYLIPELNPYAQAIFAAFTGAALTMANVFMSVRNE